jgi:hypothetical protein
VAASSTVRLVEGWREERRKIYPSVPTLPDSPGNCPETCRSLRLAARARAAGAGSGAAVGSGLAVAFARIAV